VHRSHGNIQIDQAWRTSFSDGCDAVTVLRLREVIGSPSIRSALERSSDALTKFALRAVERVLLDRSLSHREAIHRLWDVLDDAHLNKALGLPPNTFGPYLSRH
jgi:hypothetical protein